ncbi:hypothetical protein [Halobellus sp. GM3]|uniref:hypothetical protein n=1 Tax=Halobellus sp. GM3 TaxID=3458410 RepID=UPI00403D73F1
MPTGGRRLGDAHDLARVIDVPVVRVRYELETKNRTLGSILDERAERFESDTTSA